MELPHNIITPPIYLIFYLLRGGTLDLDCREFRAYLKVHGTQ